MEGWDGASFCKERGGGSGYRQGAHGSAWSLRAKETITAFADFHIVFIMLACVFNIHLCCLLTQAFVLTAAGNGMG